MRLGLLVSLVPVLFRLQAAPPVPTPQAFFQEIPLHHSPSNGRPNGPIQLLDRSSEGIVRAFSTGHWSRLAGSNWVAEPALDPHSSGEFSVAGPDGSRASLPLPWDRILQVLRLGPSVHVITSADPYSWVDGRLVSLGWPSRFEIRQGAISPNGTLFLASNAGLFERIPSGWHSIDAFDSVGRSWAATNVLGVAFDSSDRLWFATKAGVACRTSSGWRFFEGRDGLPWNDFTGIATGPGGNVWFGTRLGAIWWDGTEFHYRQGPLWLPHDHVVQTLVDDSGSAWFATPGGLGRIERRSLTLQAKAEFYEGEIARHIKRTPYGYVAEAPLGQAGDRSTATPQDSDNDGLWTAMYGAGECFDYAATGKVGARERAHQAFEALRFLQIVTQGGDHAPPLGFVARTIRPIDWPDPNSGRLEDDLLEQKRDALWKAPDPRWPKSADGRWYWKSDTSSDELDGHYFFYPLYYDFCADTETEKARVRQVVRDLTDHLLTHDFQLIDHDGKPTRWGVYRPRDLNENPLWWAERGLNSLSMLTYLAVASHITGDPKYAAASRLLIDQHGYAQNLMYPKVQQGPGSGNHSDDEMAFMCYYNLLRLSKDESLKAAVRYSFFQSWSLEQPERNPFFHFAYAGINLGQSVTNGWGTYPLSPWDGWLEDSVATLRGFPLDRLNWPHRNSHRLDVQPLRRQKSRDLYDAGRGGRGQRIDGRVVAVENRHFEHWNTDPWELDYGGSGNVLGSGTVFLLPYYMGLFHGFIAKP